MIVFDHTSRTGAQLTIYFFVDGTFYQRCLQSMLQFVIIRPLSVLAAVILEFFHLYDEGNFSPERGYLYLTIIGMFIGNNRLFLSLL